MLKLKAHEDLDQEVDEPKEFTMRKIKERYFENYMAWIEKFQYENKIITKD